ncbi:MAG: trehalose-phosphatase [Rhodospirillales bacterium]|nr:trehalose-phosphatase [Rhodospirillales bacterium]
MPQCPLLPALSRDCALFLDIDGTLLDFSLSPDGVIVPSGLLALLQNLKIWLGGALALLSGRKLADIEALFGSNFAAGAEHGAFLRNADGAVLAETQPNPALAALVVPLREAVAARSGTLLEEKRFGLTLHWRAAPAMAGELTALAGRLAAPHPGLLLLPAHSALEIRPGGTDKGSALEAFMRQPPFSGRRPVFIGDDITDEPAIARANELGGVGLHVARDFGGTTQAVRNWLTENLERKEAGDATA